MTPLISAVICTYNRASLLPGAIQSLVEQTLPPEQFEVIVVDNASTDDTPQVIERCRVEAPAHTILMVYEPEPGLGRSRNTAMNQAQGRYIAYLDDDARATKDYLEKALLLLQGSGSPACVGGPIRPFYTSTKPAWFKDEYESRSWGSEPRPLRPGESFSGSNMAWDSKYLGRLGGFAENVGVSGQTLSLGEEAGAFKKLWHADPSAVLLYSPELVVYHWVAPYKLSVGYALRRAFADGQSDIRLRGKLSVGWRLHTLARSSAAVVWWKARALFRLKRYPALQNWAVEEGRPISGKLGVVLAVLGIWVTVHQR